LFVFKQINEKRVRNVNKTRELIDTDRNILQTIAWKSKIKSFITKNKILGSLKSEI